MKQQLWMMWCSGAFGLAAMLHLVRTAAGWPLVIGPWSVPLGMSAVLWPMAATVSAWLTLRARPWQASAARPSRMPPLEVPVGEERAPAFNNSAASADGLHYHFVDEDDEVE